VILGTAARPDRGEPRDREGLLIRLLDWAAPRDPWPSVSSFLPPATPADETYAPASESM